MLPDREQIENAKFSLNRCVLNKVAVDNAIRDLSNEMPSFYSVETKDLNHRGDNLHFDTESLHTLGERYYSVYEKVVKG